MAQEDFQARLKRLQGGAIADSDESQNGHAEASAIQEAAARAKARRAREEVSVLPDWRENIRYPLSLVGAFAVGMIAVLLVRYARYHVVGGSLVGADADIAMIIDAALAGGIGMVFRTVIRSGEKEFVTAKAFGIAAMIGIMHNFVHYMPGVFEVLFSPEWVDEVLYMTRPNSILFRGISFVLVQPAA